MQTTAAPPSPRAHPILGSAIDVRRSQIETYERAMREQGDVVRLALGPPGLRLELYCFFHPDGVHRVLAGPRGTYSKSNRFYKQIAAAFGNGLLTRANAGSASGGSPSRCSRARRSPPTPT
jgi:hypothetical protein